MEQLYVLALRAVAKNLKTDPLCQKYQSILPQHLRADIIYQLFEDGNLEWLGDEICKTENLKLLLRTDRQRFHAEFQCLIDHKKDRIVLRMLSVPKDVHVGKEGDGTRINFRLDFGDFLLEAGSFHLAELTYTAALQLIQRRSAEPSIITAMQCCEKILRAQVANCCYTKATAMVDCIRDMLRELSDESGENYNKAVIYTEISAILFAESRYDSAFKHCFYALNELSKPGLPVSAVIHVLKFCSKGCVVRREFKLAKRLILQAVKLAYDCFGGNHLKYADTLIDYGFYLLNIDQVSSAVYVYQKALEIRKNVFKGKNLQVGIAHEDLAYSLYVNEYNSGNFETAIDHATTAGNILKESLPRDHLLLGSSNRVRALILEEIAIDLVDDKQAKEHLLEALELHLESLDLAIKAFGEENVQTAKHYGNLGRLNQTLSQFQEAEEFHKKAIDIKTELLGEDDYEVALSIGHLASLYNYDMQKYEEAEALYKKSVELTIKLFGKGFRGLQYDYQGLINLYEQRMMFDEVDYYDRELQTWTDIRQTETEEEASGSPLDYLDNDSRPEAKLVTGVNSLVEYVHQLYPHISIEESVLYSITSGELTAVST